MPTWMCGHLVDGATEALEYALARGGFDATDEDPPPASYWRAKALLYIAVIALRALRAAAWLIRVGYEPEALTFKRTLSEALSRARRVHDDQSGEYARQWLQGRAGKPQKALLDYPEGLWELLSHAAHVDHRAIENSLAVTDDEGNHRVVVAPERRPVLVNATLVTCAAEARDVAVVIGLEHGFEWPPWMATLTDELMAANERYLPDPPDNDEANLAEPG
jgi:hypothetical protein